MESDWRSTGRRFEIWTALDLQVIDAMPYCNSNIQHIIMKSGGSSAMGLQRGFVEGYRRAVWVGMSYSVHDRHACLLPPFGRPSCTIAIRRALKLVIQVPCGICVAKKWSDIRGRCSCNRKRDAKRFRFVPALLTVLSTSLDFLWWPSCPSAIFPHPRTWKTLG